MTTDAARATPDGMTRQRCENGKHGDWATDCKSIHVCPWCQIENLAALLADRGLTAPEPCTT